jgi:uncharacterized protein DUF11
MAVRLGRLVLGLVAVALIGPAPASASHERWVTFAARVCDDYTQVTGNRARNNIMESLKDLGANTPYGTKLPDGRIVPNEVDPAIEYEFQPPPGCRPLAGWKFKLGTGYQTKADPGVWGSLSRVTDPYSTDITTSATTALYDRFHNRVTVGGNDVTIAGATTIELTDAQRDQSSRGQALWLQGGVPGTPITGDPNLYGFAALRCATDNLNGDNVEFVAYPTGGVNHVFCFAYYVSPAPKPGKIVVTKRLAPDNLPNDFPKQTVRFTGNISYEKDNQGVGFFNLTAGPGAPGSTTFERAAGTDWTFTEQAPTADFVASTPTCTSTPAPGGAASVVTINGRAVSVALAAGDTVRCTFVNTARRPPVGQLLLRKVTKNNVGRFRFDLDEVDGPDTATRTIETEVEDIAHDATPLTRLVPGDYRITETLPESDAGTWLLDNVFCGGEPVDISGDDRVRVTVPSTSSQTCTFTNRFRHAGAISISKTTLGGVATTRFQIRPIADPEVEYEQLATTRQPGERVDAEGDRTTAIPLGQYAIQETTASTEGDRGFWRVVRVECDRDPEYSETGRIVIRLTTSDPEIHCHFVNQLVRPVPPDPEPIPPEPTPPSPPEEVPSGGVSPAEASNLAELRVTKSASRRRVTLGGRVRYRVVVRNRGPATARSVVIAEHNRATLGRIVRARTSKGSCRQGPPRYCSLGNLRRGQSVVITVTALPNRLGRVPNVVAVHTGSPQRTRRGKIARASVVVVPRPVPRFTG